MKLHKKRSLRAIVVITEESFAFFDYYCFSRQDAQKSKNTHLSIGWVNKLVRRIPRDDKLMSPEKEGNETERKGDAQKSTLSSSHTYVHTS
tara:strand:- start:1603 stop:1875 length:273 start_codon:yes stop_codon:yes gene_type:complete